MLKIVKDAILQEDIESISDGLDCNEFLGKTVLITGATGLIGSQITLALICANIKRNLNIKVIALARSQEKAKKVFENVLQEANFKILYQDIKEPINIEDSIDYIIHTASVTSSKDFVDYPVETISTLIQGTQNVLELAKSKKITSMVYLSSLEIYGVTDFNLESVKETDYGYIDHLNVRSSYSEGKRMTECLCVAYKSKYNVPVKIARLAQTFGAGVDYNDSRVFAQFARSAIEKKDIILHTDGSTIRNYCYTTDAINALLTIMTKGISGEAYNVANPDTTISIKDMAKIIVNNYDGVQLIFDTDDGTHGYNPKVKISLNTEKLEQLGWRAEVGLEETYEKMIKSMETSKKEGCCR